MKRAFLLRMMLAAAPLSRFAQDTARAPLAGKLLITGSALFAIPIARDGSARFWRRRSAWCASSSARLLPAPAAATRLQRWWKSFSFKFRSAALRSLIR